MRINDVTPAVIQKYAIDKMAGGLSPNTVTKHLRIISKCLDNAVRQDLILHNPVKRIEMPKRKRYTGAKHYNEHEIEQLLECSKNDPLEVVIMLTLFYGLRRSEVLGLKWDAIDFNRKTITIKHTVVKIGDIVHKSDSTKNDSSYAAFPIPEKIIIQLERWKERQQVTMIEGSNNDGYVCTHADGRHIAPQYVSQHFVSLLTKFNLPRIRFHDLRHSSASFLKSLGFDLKDIQVWLRHKDIQTTMNLYTHLDMTAKSNIADTLNNKLKLLDSEISSKRINDVAEFV